MEITVVNLNVPSIGTHKHIKQILRDLKREVDYWLSVLISQFRVKTSQ
jgi:hypothetical protein